MIALAFALPGALLLWDAMAGGLGTNPLEALTRETGRWSFLFLLGTLALTPLRHAGMHAARLAGLRLGRRPSDWNWTVPLRRPAGLASFGYAAAHVAVYLWLDAGLDAGALLDDLRHRPFIAAGAGAFVLLLPLAATSTDGWMRRLKRAWKRLHRAIYAIALLAALHYLWLSKPGLHAPTLYAGAVALLLGYRLALWLWSGLRQADALGETAPARRQTTAAKSGAGASDQTMRA